MRNHNGRAKLVDRTDVEANDYCLTPGRYVGVAPEVEEEGFDFEEALCSEFPGVAGYSRRNIFYMREFYLAYHDQPKVQPLVAQKGENPAIGIILCKEKSRTIVEYALRQAKKPIGVAAYRIVKRLPKELKGQLPTPEEIAKLLEGGR